MRTTKTLLASAGLLAVHARQFLFQTVQRISSGSATDQNLGPMKTHKSMRNSCAGILAGALFFVGVTAHSADTPTLKQAYKDHFYVGTAINRSIATGTPVRAGFSNRTLEQVQKDVALVKEQ